MVEPLNEARRPSDRRVAQLSDSAWLDSVFGTLKEREPCVLVGNRWQPPRSGRISESIDPSTGSVVGRHAVGGDEDVDAAVQAAAQAQPTWGALTTSERAAYLARLGERVADHAGHLATIDAIDAGMPLPAMLRDVDGIQRVLQGWLGFSSALRGDVMESAEGLHFTRHAPYGVVARIIAFNHPIYAAFKGALAPLLAGNTVVLKPADQTPMSALALGDHIRDVLPEGVFNIVTGDGETGAALVSHPRVRRIAFTGSVATGRRIQETAAQVGVKHVSLELGGKNAMIVFPDVDTAAVVDGVVTGMNLRTNQGQSCGSTSRILIHRSLYDEVCSKLAEVFSGLVLGPAYQADVDMGPVISAEAKHRILETVASGLDDGADLVVGGADDPRTQREGYFVAPTLFADVPPDARIANEEIFGPVVCLMPWSDEREAIELANAVDYGLTASVWTSDLTRALRTADAMETGYVWVNSAGQHYFGMPFGGWKDSGVGREGSFEELLSFLQLKSVNVRLS